MPRPEQWPWARLAAASARVRFSHVSLAMIGDHGMAALVRRSAAAMLSPGAGATTHSCRASSASSWHCITQSHVAGKAGCEWMPHAATVGLSPYWSTHAGKSGSAQPAPLVNGGQSHRPRSALHVPRPQPPTHAWPPAPSSGYVAGAGSAGARTACRSCTAAAASRVRAIDSVPFSEPSRVPRSRSRARRAATRLSGSLPAGVGAAAGPSS
mmetsp:Transcript_25661/g.82348  ORF Transcript_25661/g.82348 Transcript_25661/m.82348 type:complete len:211 (+) Transcript_25661:287-919(+)